MTGLFLVEGPGASSKERDPRHDHVLIDLRTARGTRCLIYNDVRRFGFMDLVADAAQSRHLLGMGPEPLGPDFTPQSLAKALKASDAPVKSALLNQKFVAGVGNIYACEALFYAGISPRRKARRVAPRAEGLHRALVGVLREAIEMNGSSIRDFAGANGARGGYQEAFRVYGREGKPCGDCGRSILRVVQSGRATYYCRACQT
jgi:formamidopyrimidine-DNA glycosylase